MSLENLGSLAWQAISCFIFCALFLPRIYCQTQIALEVRGRLDSNFPKADTTLWSHKKLMRLFTLIAIVKAYSPGSYEPGTVHIFQDKRCSILCALLSHWHLLWPGSLCDMKQKHSKIYLFEGLESVHSILLNGRRETTTGGNQLIIFHGSLPPHSSCPCFSSRPVHVSS